MQLSLPLAFLVDAAAEAPGPDRFLAELGAAPEPKTARFSPEAP